jgi:branched-chain amino acid transport system ATP-binding protein
MIQLLSLTDVVIYYGQMEVIKNISIEVKKGELISVIGPNGAGKTTLIKSIMGLKDISSGKIMFEGNDISKVPAWKRAEMGIGFIPEGRRVFGNLTVEENLKMGCYKVKDNKTIRRNIDRTYELFPRLAERKNQLAKTMSGGEQQMLAIGRALALEPKLLLIDEISMGLMPIMVNTCFKIIKELNESGITVLVVEQNANKVLKIADRGYVLETGKIVIEDTAQNLRENDVVQKAYLGS